jgi:PPOX class probable F420-dependent enzyme
MTVAERLAAASNRLYDAIRSPRAREASKGEARARSLDILEGHKYCLLTTYKRSGEPVPTPVWFGLADGKLYFRTYANAVKIKRIRNNPNVLVGPCDVRGKPKGATAEARARVLGDEEDAQAEKAIQSNYGLFRRVYEKSFAMRVAGAYVEVTPA